MITVKDLIVFLQAQQQDLPIAYCCYSEQCLMGLGNITIIDACKPRLDGWVQDERPDMESQKYLLFPGN